MKNPSLIQRRSGTGSVSIGMRASARAEHANSNMPVPSAVVRSITPLNAKWPSSMSDYNYVDALQVDSPDQVWTPESKSSVGCVNSEAKSSATCVSAAHGSVRSGLQSNFVQPSQVETWLNPLQFPRATACNPLLYSRRWPAVVRFPLQMGVV